MLCYFKTSNDGMYELTISVSALVLLILKLLHAVAEFYLDTMFWFIKL